LDIQLLVRQYPRMIGLARYTACLREGLQEAGMPYETTEPTFPPWVRLADTLLSPLGYDMRTFFSNFPVAAPLKEGAVKHLTTQMMASLLRFQPKLSQTIVTVHDIVPYLMRSEPGQNTYHHRIESCFDSLAMKSLVRADKIIAISSYTKRVLVNELQIPEEKIQVVLYGLDHNLFRPVRPDEEFWARHNLNPDNKHVLYVGSENPRKNLERLIRAFAEVKARLPKLKFIKVGTPEYLLHAERLRKLVNELDISNDVLFVDHPSQDDLVRFYSTADIFVFPSLYEGFGMPPLEAMACGTPVVTSNTSSLPEVVGDAAIRVDPTNIEQIANAIWLVLSQPALAAKLREKGLSRAAQFTWEKTAKDTIAIYEAIGGY
jgi:glycosyltransferase involved in cell wall biosynthesis